MQIPHRKKVKHYDEPGHVHVLTFSCYQRLPLLNNPEWKDELCIAIDRAIALHHYDLFAYVLMPEHVHLIVHAQTNSSLISKLLGAIKRPFSYRIKQQLIESNEALLEQLTIRQRPSVLTFRFWQEGSGFDSNLTESSKILAAIEYVHNNPVRRGLSESATEWKWSSASWYEDSTKMSIPVLKKPDYDILN